MPTAAGAAWFEQHGLGEGDGVADVLARAKHERLRTRGRAILKSAAATSGS